VRSRLDYNFYVYILSNEWRTIYVGVTNDLERRVWEHKNKAVPGFTTRYDIDRLIYFEHFTDIRDAIAREKQIKGWKRFKKVALVDTMNPQWKDLAADWFAP
jgi:putative endonuclease